MKVYKISGDDYSALTFKDEYKGRVMSDVAKELFNGENTVYTRNDGEYFWELTIAGEITDIHSYEVGKSLQDYDDSKHTDLIIENEIIKG